MFLEQVLFKGHRRIGKHRISTASGVLECHFRLVVFKEFVTGGILLLPLIPAAADANAVQSLLARCCLAA